MKTEKHVVTIPIADYNELFQSNDMIGAKKIIKSDRLYEPLMQAIFKKALEDDKFCDLIRIEKQVELFIKITNV